MNSNWLRNSLLLLLLLTYVKLMLNSHGSICRPRFWLAKNVLRYGNVKRYDPNNITAYVHPLFVVYSINFYILPRVTKACHRPSTASSVFTFQHLVCPTLFPLLPSLRENSVTWYFLKGRTSWRCVSVHLVWNLKNVGSLAFGLSIMY